MLQNWLLLCIIFIHFQLELQFPASNDEKYIFIYENKHIRNEISY